MSQWSHYSEPDPEWVTAFAQIEASLPPLLQSVDGIPTTRLELAKHLKHTLEVAEYPSE